MKPYMSYWSGGYRKIPNQYIINMHKISAFFLKKNFNEVHFITDSESLPYFKDIKFSSISTDFDLLSKEYGEVWSLNKLYAYKLISQKGDPFFHIDYDVILWGGLREKFKKAAIFAQCEERRFHESYEIEKFLKNCPNLYLAGEIQKPKYAINVGILGGSDLEFFYNYADSALKLVLDPINKDFWVNYKGFSTNWSKAVIPEQYYLAVCEEYYNKKIETLFSKQWPEEDEILEKKYTHLMGAKDQKEVEEKINVVTKLLNL